MPAGQAARVCIFLFHKDSPWLLQSWLEHYLVLFAAAAITIIDHSSTDSDTLALLRSAAAKGVRVDTFNGPFRNKHAELTKRMRHKASACDFLIPTDNDELLVVHEDGQYRFDRAAVERAFGKLLPTADARRRYKLGAARALLCDATLCTRQHAANLGALRRAGVQVPRRPLGLADQLPGNLCQDKTFYPARSFQATDQGNHYGELRGEGKAFESRTARLCNVTMQHALYFPEHHGLAFLDLGYALPHAEYRSKHLRAAAAYNYTVASNCDPRVPRVGQHYCDALKSEDVSNATSYCRSMQQRCCERANTTAVGVAGRSRRPKAVWEFVADARMRISTDADGGEVGCGGT